MPSRCPGVAGPPALARTEGGEGSAGQSYHQNSKGTGEQHKAERIKEGHRMYSHTAKLQELWRTTQIQTIHIPKSMTDASFLKAYVSTAQFGKRVPGDKNSTPCTQQSLRHDHIRILGKEDNRNVDYLRREAHGSFFDKGLEKHLVLPGDTGLHASYTLAVKSPHPVFQHPELTSGQKRYLCSIAKICSSSYLRTLMKRQYMHLFHHGLQKPGVLTHHRSHISSRYSQKQHSPCTTWRHHLEREDSLGIAAEAPEMIIHSLWRPLRHKEGLKIGYASKTRCKSLKIFRRPGRLFLLPVSSKDYQPCANDETEEEDLLNECMQSMSIQEQGSSHASLTVSCPTPSSAIP